MTTHKVADLTGPLLDAAVAKADGGMTTRLRTVHPLLCSVPIEPICWLYDEVNGYAVKAFQPSTNWADGGPIIQRERIHLAFNGDGTCESQVWRDPAEALHPIMRGPSPLMAAMRAYVASRFGEAVQLP